MNISDLFISGVNSEAVNLREWWFSIFSIVLGGVSEDAYLYKISRTKDSVKYFDGSDWVPIEGADPTKPLARFKDPIYINPGEIKNYKGDKPLLTTFGNVLVNQVSFVMAFGDRIPFKTGYIDMGKFGDYIAKHLVDEDAVTDDPLAIRPSEKLIYDDNTLALQSLNTLAVVTMSEKSLRGHPRRDEVIAQLKEEYKDRLSDPAVVAKIAEVTQELDREWLSGDPTMPYYETDPKKLFGIVRKRLYYFFGGEAPFEDGTTVTFIEKPLSKGISLEHIDILNNEARSGSYFRGNQTKLAGVVVKGVYRMLGGARISEDDCGDKLGMPCYITKEYANKYVDHYAIIDSKLVRLTNENIADYYNQWIRIRSPMTCKTDTNSDGESGKGKGKELCKICVGDNLSNSADGMAAAAAGVGGRFLTAFLKKFHGSALRTTKWNFKDRLS